MFSLVVLVICAVTATNAGFHHRHHHHHSTDMEGFQNFGHNGFMHHHHRRHFGPPNGPHQPGFPQNAHNTGWYPHSHGPHCKHQPGDLFGMASITPNTVPNFSHLNQPFNFNMYPNAMIPNSNFPNPIPFPTIFTNPFNLGNFPQFPQQPFSQQPFPQFPTFPPFITPNSNNPFNNGNIPSNTQQNNNGFDQMYNPFYNPVKNPVNSPATPLPNSQSNFNTFTLTPLDANTAFDNNQNKPTENAVFNGGNEPQNPTTPASTSQSGNEGSISGVQNPNDANTKTNQNNDNNYNGSGAIVPNNDFDINNQTNGQSVDEPSTAASPTEGKFNGLDYDIDIRFGGSNNKRANQTTTETIK